MERLLLLPEPIKMLRPGLFIDAKMVVDIDLRILSALNASKIFRF